MLRRSWALAIVGLFTVALAPAWAQGYDKEAVKALSKKIDNHLAKVWAKAKVTPAAKAEDHVFFRRLNLDLSGRIPDLLDIGDFTDNPDPDKRWEWVDKMLDSPRYNHPKHFAAVWRNIIIGNQTNPQFQFLQGQFENWIRERLDKNVPMNEFVLQLLTAQQGGPGMGRGFDPNNQSSPQLFVIANENGKPETMAGSTSRVFLGVKIECAQCHKHPFAKWTQDQFWEFAAFYSAPQFAPKGGGKGPAVPQPGFTPGRQILIPGTEKVVNAKYLNGQEPDWTNSNNSRKTLAEWVTDKDNPYFAKAMADHIWGYLMGVSLLEPIMEPSDDNLMTHPELLNDLAQGLIDAKFDPKFLIRAIVHSDAYQRTSAGAKIADKEDYQLFVRMPMRSLSPEQIYDNLIMATRRGRDPNPVMNNQQFFNPGALQSPRAQFLNKFQTQDRRHEPQTSILQALFMMNSKALGDLAKLENNEDLRQLAAQRTPHEQRLRSLYMMVLSRPPRDAEVARLMPILERAAAADEEGKHVRLGEAVADIYWALLNSSEFLLNH